MKRILIASALGLVATLPSPANAVNANPGGGLRENKSKPREDRPADRDNKPSDRDNKPPKREERPSSRNSSPLSPLFEPRPSRGDDRGPVVRPAPPRPDRDNGGPRNNGPRDNGPRNNGPRDNNWPRDNGPRGNNGPRDWRSNDDRGRGRDLDRDHHDKNWNYGRDRTVIIERPVYVPSYVPSYAPPIYVEPRDPRLDELEVIARQIKTALRLDPDLGRFNLDTDTVGYSIELEGFVDTPQQLQLALDVARDIDKDVRIVITRVRIR